MVFIKSETVISKHLHEEMNPQREATDLAYIYSRSLLQHLYHLL